MERLTYNIILGLFCLFLVGGCVITFTPLGRYVFNKNMYIVEKIDDATNYKKRKQVEDTCRAMISSYMSDKSTWEQYKDSESELERSWSSQAMMRANKTAITYNEYVLKNSYVWEGNIPSDINQELQLLTKE